MAANPLPLDFPFRLGQRWRRKPPHAKAQRQRIPNDQLAGPAAFHVAERAGTIRNARVEHPTVVLANVVLGRAVQQHIQVRANVHVARLEGPRKRKHEGNVLLRREFFAHVLDLRRRPHGQSAGQRGVRVDVELEQVEKGIRDHGDGAIDFAFEAVVKFEGFLGLLAHGEGDPFDFVALGVFNVLARFSRGRMEGMLVGWCHRMRECESERGEHHSRAPIHALDMDRGAVVVGSERELAGGGAG